MIAVFKTNITSKAKIKKLKPVLDQQLPNARWNFDLEDCDKILRVESAENIVAKVIRIFQEFGFLCIELQ